MKEINFQEVNYLAPKEVHELMKKYLDACHWGDVPDYAHAIAAYLNMDGYVILRKR